MITKTIIRKTLPNGFLYIELSTSMTMGIIGRIDDKLYLMYGDREMRRYNNNLFILLNNYKWEEEDSNFMVRLRNDIPAILSWKYHEDKRY